MNENEYISWFKDTFYKDFTEDSLGRRWIDEIAEKLSARTASRDKWKELAEKLFDATLNYYALFEMTDLDADNQACEAMNLFHKMKKEIL